MGKGTFLGEFEQMVLLAILRLQDNAYGVHVRRVIEERAGRLVTIGALYAALERLERKRFLTSRETAPEPIRGGRAKRVYTVTTMGTRALSHSQAMMRNMAEGLALDSERPGA
jgi:DNA-binding PadR family transcriptional regulator